MSEPVQHEQTVSTNLPEVRQVPLTACLAWLRLGLADLRGAWMVSLAHGALFAGLGWLLVTYAWGDPHWAVTFTSGFLIVAPILAVCFYDISRSLERGERPATLMRPVQLLRENGWSIGLFLILLALLFSLWERVTAITVALTLKADVYAYGHKTFSYTASIVNDPNHLPVVIGFFAVGALFALIAFVLSAVALPMMVDRPVDPVTAMLTSLRVVWRNVLPMLVWAGVIVSLVLLGYLTLFIGLIFIFPLLGHATWHAYRATVAPGV